jgi:hypothetical protein
MILLSVHLVFTAFMTGVIWFVQLVHYPSFRFIDRFQFESGMKYHQRFTTFIVGPAILSEGSTGAVLLFNPSALLNPFFLWVNAAGLIAIWSCTYFLSVPKHERLLLGYDGRTIQSLTLTNWPRTLIWSGRLVLLTFLLGTNL